MRHQDGEAARTRSKKLFMRWGWAALTALGAVGILLATTATSGTGRQIGAAAPAGDAGTTRGTVPVDGATLSYTRTGNGPPLVLLHGWPQTSWTWHKVVPDLARNHTVITFDLPGLGGSSVPADGYDKATTAKRIRQGVHALGFRKVSILSHDLGSLVAYPYARDFPAEVDRLIVMDAPLSGFGLEDFYARLWHFGFNSAPAPVPEQIINDDNERVYLGYIFDHEHVAGAVDRAVYFRAYRQADKRSAGYGYYRAFTTDAADNQANADAKRLTMPVLAMGGQFSFGPAVAASFRNVAADVREVIAPRSGHFIPEENPDFLAGCASVFFGGPNVAPPSPELAVCS